MRVIYVDADGCPVKEEVYRVARRYRMSVTLVSNSPMRVPSDDDIQLVVVGQGFDEADDWIVERIGPGDVVVTTDIPLASRCLKKGSRALGPKGRVFREDSIGDALASREAGQYLRELGVNTGGPAPFTDRDRSRFLQALDNEIHAAMRHQ